LLGEIRRPQRSGHSFEKWKEAGQRSEIFNFIGLDAETARHLSVAPNLAAPSRNHKLFGVGIQAQSF
jgi:hypothetical protein